jgi:hypothetical protein
MPWQIDGEFIRTNIEFSGNNVWGQDLSAGYKIIASRHDLHDEDLAEGIEQCINTSGYNAMLAELNMGDNIIKSLLPGVAGTDAINVNQLDVVDDKADQNAIDIAALVTSDPDSIITAMTFDALELTADRAVGDFVVPLKRFNDFKAGQIIRHFGQDLVAATSTDVDTGTGNRFYMPNNLTGAMDLNIIRPVGDDPDLGDNYFVEGLVIVENQATPAAITLQADGVDVDASDIIGAPTLNANTNYTLSYMIQWDNGTYHEAYVWSAP